MRDLEKTCRIAVVQSEPVLFDPAAGTQAVVDRIDTIAAEHPSDLIVFPELLIPGYPSVLVDGPEMALVGQAAARAGAWVSLGISERHPVNGTLYNTNVVFAPDGHIDAIHRKLKPTGSERLVWGDAQDHYFPVSQTPWGPMGTLICWENYMPLARVALYQKGVTLYLAPNTNDNPEWQATLQHIAIEGRCYVVNCAPYIRRTDYPLDQLVFPEEVERLPEVVYRGGSCVVDPKGHYVEPGVLYATLDLDAVASAKWEFDPVGHYARPDVLDLRVNDR